MENDSNVVEWIEGIPNELVEHHIFPCLDPNFLLRLCLVNKYWDDHIPAQISSLDVSHNTYLPDVPASSPPPLELTSVWRITGGSISRLTNLTSLHLHDNLFITSPGFHRKAPNPVRLPSNTILDDAVLSSLTKLTSWTISINIHISSPPVTCAINYILKYRNVNNGTTEDPIAWHPLLRK